MNKKVYVDLSQQDVQDIINAYEKDIEKFNKQKEVLDKIKKMFEHSNLIKYYYGMSYEFEINDFKDDILELLEEIDSETRK